jgi:hypothetical protein
MGWKVEDHLGGVCPFQGYLRLDGGELVYFRARGSSASFEVWPASVQLNLEGDLPDEDPIWAHRWDDRWEWPEAGFIEESEAKELIEEAVERYASWKAARAEPEGGAA